MDHDESVGDERTIYAVTGTMEVIGGAVREIPISVRKPIRRCLGRRWLECEIS